MKKSKKSIMQTCTVYNVHALYSACMIFGGK